MDTIVQEMTFDFFGAGKHKIGMEKLFSTDSAVFLDVRSLPEVESIQLNLKHHINVLHIPIDEIPNRIEEIPKDNIIGIFCSAGTRSAIVYVYLRMKGYTNVYITLGGYEAVTNLILPGKLLQRIKTNITKE